MSDKDIATNKPSLKRIPIDEQLGHDIFSCSECSTVYGKEIIKCLVCNADFRKPFNPESMRESFNLLRSAWEQFIINKNKYDDCIIGSPSCTGPENMLNHIVQYAECLASMAKNLAAETGTNISRVVR